MRNKRKRTLASAKATKLQMGMCVTHLFGIGSVALTFLVKLFARHSEPLKFIDIIDFLLATDVLITLVLAVIQLYVPKFSDTDIYGRLLPREIAYCGVVILTLIWYGIMLEVESYNLFEYVFQSIFYVSLIGIYYDGARRMSQAIERYDNEQSGHDIDTLSCGDENGDDG